MSYNTINRNAADEAFLGRLNAAAAAEGAPDPISKGWNLRWPVAATSDIEAAYASALASENPNPGGDETVITDGMILSAVQAHWDDTPTLPT